MARVETEIDHWNKKAESCDDEIVLSGRASVALTRSFLSLMRGKGVVLKDRGSATQEHIDEMVQFIVQKSNLVPEDRILDVGCGNGIITQLLSGKCSIVGMDISKKMLEKARQKDQLSDYVLGEAARIPFSNSCFDDVISISVIHHFPSYEYTEGAIEEMLRVIKPGGKIVLCKIPVNFSSFFFEYQIMQLGKKVLKHFQMEQDRLPYSLLYTSSFFDAYCNEVYNSGTTMAVVIHKPDICAPSVVHPESSTTSETAHSE
jgi:2-polyprenyl-3-methyl-5-hydroxy-6-metoxy-1,4-benzoquinol methylase